MAAGANEGEYDDLEYHVTFPTPTPGRDQDDQFNTLEHLLQMRETAVMMIGWMGCQDRYLAKYSKIYEDAGCATVRYSPSVKDMLGSNAQQVAKKLLEVLVEMNLSDNPVLFHIFSNGGCVIYNAMREELHSNPDFEEIDKLGVTYDSAPGRPRISQQVNIVFSGFQPGIITGVLKMGFYFFNVIRLGVKTLFELLGMTLAPSLYDKMIYYPNDCPELYLFSKADELITYSDIENVIERRRMQSVDISAVCWDDSPHVQHLKTHRESYIKHCRDFLMVALAQQRRN